jgi:hypothetical protein
MGERFLVDIIRTTDEQRDNSGRLISNIQCEHIFFELLDEYIDYKEFINVTAQTALSSHSVNGNALYLGGGSTSMQLFKNGGINVSASGEFYVEGDNRLTLIAI